MTVGKAPHVILGQEMLKPRDGAEKDEGELTGGKRLIKRLRQRHVHFADVIVADALYLNAPFINTVKENGLDAVIRLKDEKRLIFQDAEGLFNQGKGKKKSFQHGKKTIEVWDLSKFEMENCPYRLRVVRYHESWQENGKEAERWIWLVTTLEETAPLSFMGDDELQVGYRGKWIPSVKDVLPCKALLLSCGSRNHI
ncbi:MAG: transposase [Pilosibacter sp.]